MHYKVFQEAMGKAQSMPHDDLVLILGKPDTTDRKADLTWRRTCLRHGIETSALGVKTSDPVRYEKNYAAAEHLGKAREKIERLESELRALNTKLALYRVTNR